MKRTKFGQWMYNWVTPASLWIAKHKFLFYVLTYTWGLSVTLLGNILFYGSKILFKKIDSGKYYTSNYFVFGHNWGGMECGRNFLVSGDMSEEWTLHTKKHELGHTYQNAILGPFALILGAIPSALRYHYRNIVKKINPKKELPAYDDFWYEGSATYIGTTFVEEKESL